MPSVYRLTVSSHLYFSWCQYPRRKGPRAMGQASRKNRYFLKPGKLLQPGNPVLLTGSTRLFSEAPTKALSYLQTHLTFTSAFCFLALQVPFPKVFCGTANILCPGRLSRDVPSLRMGLKLYKLKMYLVHSTDRHSGSATAYPWPWWLWGWQGVMPLLCCLTLQAGIVPHTANSRKDQNSNYELVSVG